MNKLEYIMNQFKRTHHKKYENYCIERLITLIDNPNLQFITQQMFRRDDEKIALADLYFPQLNVIVEIDEKYHNDETQKEADKHREKEILRKLKNLNTVVQFEPECFRISAGNNETLESINSRIKEIKEKLEKKINKLGQLEWNVNGNTVEEWIEKGIISIDDYAQFNTVWEVSELFNKGYKEGSQKMYVKCQENYYFWCPKLKLEDTNVDVPYLNEISIDSKYIYESQKEDNDEFVNRYINDAIRQQEKRYVFPKYMTETGEMAYVFKGVYELDLGKTKKINKRVWKRVDNEVLDLSIFHGKSL